MQTKTDKSTTIKLIQFSDSIQAEVRNRRTIIAPLDDNISVFVIMTRLIVFNDDEDRKRLIDEINSRHNCSIQHRDHSKFGIITTKMMLHRDTLDMLYLCRQRLDDIPPQNYSTAPKNKVR